MSRRSKGRRSGRSTRRDNTKRYIMDEKNIKKFASHDTYIAQPMVYTPDVRKPILQSQTPRQQPVLQSQTPAVQKGSKVELPKLIDFNIKQCLGKLLDRRTPKDKLVSQTDILDACAQLETISKLLKSDHGHHMVIYCYNHGIVGHIITTLVNIRDQSVDKQCLQTILDYVAVLDRYITEEYRNISDTQIDTYDQYFKKQDKEAQNYMYRFRHAFDSFVSELKLGKITKDSYYTYNSDLDFLINNIVKNTDDRDKIHPELLLHIGTCLNLLAIINKPDIYDGLFSRQKPTPDAPISEDEYFGDLVKKKR